MKIEGMNLSKFRKPLEESLKVYAGLLSKELSFQEFPDLYLTPDKPNSARTVVSVTYAGTEVGEMYAIVFLHKDGTGNQKTYKLEDIMVPQEFRHDDKPERVIPREKVGVIVEGFFPLFTINQHGYTIPFAAHLDELTLNEEKKVIPTFQLGQNKSKYLQAISSGLELVPKVQLTVGTDKLSGKRFGDPHAIYFGMNAHNSIQVAGFLSIKDSSNPLVSILNNYSKPKKYQ